MGIHVNIPPGITGEPMKLTDIPIEVDRPDYVLAVYVQINGGPHLYVAIRRTTVKWCKFAGTTTNYIPVAHRVPPSGILERRATMMLYPAHEILRVPDSVISTLLPNGAKWPMKKQRWIVGHFEGCQWIDGHWLEPELA